MKILANKKVIDEDKYATYLVVLKTDDSDSDTYKYHESVSQYKVMDSGILIINAVYCIGAGSEGTTHGSQQEIVEAVYAAGTWITIRYISGNGAVPS